MRKLNEGISRFTCLKFLLLFLLFCTVSCGGGGGGGGDTPVTPITLDPPANVSASDGSGNSVTITWDAVSTAKYYNIYRSETSSGTFSKIGTSATVSYSDTTAVNQKDYYYKLSTTSTTETEGQMSSSMDSGYADSKGGITNLSASNGTSSDKIVLSWGLDQTSGSFTYKVYRSDNGSTGTYNLIASPSSTNYEDSTGLTPGKMYFYKVQGVSARGAIGDISNYDNGYIPFTKPTGLAATKGTDLTRITVSWTGVAGTGVTYNVYRSTTDGSFSTVLVNQSSTSYNDTGTSEGVTNYYTVEAVSADGISSEKTASANGYKGITRPANVTAEDNKSFSRIRINWTAVSGASSYNIYRSSGGAYTSVATGITTNSWSDTTAAAGVDYTYKVSCIKNGNESQNSDASNQGSLLTSGENRNVTLTWNASRNRAVNMAGGGYTIEYSKSSTFSSGVFTQDVPYSSGSYAPTTATVGLDSTKTGTWYFRIRAYSGIGGSVSSPSAAGSIVID